MIKIALKDIKLFLMDRKAILLTILVPIVLVTLFAIVFGSIGEEEEPKGIVKEVNWGLIQSVSGVAVMMLLFSVTAMGSTILEEKEQGTLRKLLYSPIRPSQILFGKMLYTLFISSIQLSILMIYSWFVFDLEIFNNIPGLIAIILSTAFACTGFGILLASISKSRKQVESLSIIIILVMSAIGGSMIPTFLMPAFMQKMAIFSVNYWSIKGFNDILGMNVSFVKILPEVGVLIGIGLVLSLVSTFMFKRNILKVV